MSTWLWAAGAFAIAGPVALLLTASLFPRRAPGLRAYAPLVLGVGLELVALVFLAIGLLKFL